MPTRCLRSSALLPILLLGACATTPTPSPAPSTRALQLADTGTVSRAEAALAPASASLASGRLVLVAQDGGLQLSGQLGGLPAARAVGFHIHQTGDCRAVDASSAGPHFNPLDHAHGGESGGPRHLGDLGNLHADAQGRVVVAKHLPGLVLGGGAANDILGRALVVHASADDFTTQPAGNAGARIACGVIRALP